MKRCCMNFIHLNNRGQEISEQQKEYICIMSKSRIIMISKCIDGEYRADNEGLYGIIFNRREVEPQLFDYHPQTL